MIIKEELKEFGKKRLWIIRRNDEIDIVIKNYWNIKKELICNGCNRNNIVGLWYNCLIDLNNKNTNLLLISIFHTFLKLILYN